MWVRLLRSGYCVVMMLQDIASPSVEAAEALARAASLDLSMVRMKMSDPQEGRDWTDAEVDIAEQEYRRFLALHLMYPQVDVVPCGIVDEIWHTHILDTHAYAPDCQEVFGFFLHHFPYFGMRGERDAADLVTANDLTLARYHRALGEPPDGVWVDSKSAKCKQKSCRTQCKPMNCR
jgi:hypothetical protein